MSNGGVCDQKDARLKGGEVRVSSEFDRRLRATEYVQPPLLPILCDVKDEVGGVIAIILAILLPSRHEMLQVFKVK